jgi:hypothetical protein
MVLEDAKQKLTRLDILDEWPEDFARPRPGTLWKWLKTAVAADLVKVEGSGRKADPFRYWLPAVEALWRENPLYEIMEQQIRDLKIPFVSLRKKKCNSVADAALERESDRPLPKDARLWPPGSPLE